MNSRVPASLIRIIWCGHVHGNHISDNINVFVPHRISAVSDMSVFYLVYLSGISEISNYAGVDAFLFTTADAPVWRWNRWFTRLGYHGRSGPSGHYS